MRLSSVALGALIVSLGLPALPGCAPAADPKGAKAPEPPPEDKGDPAKDTPPASTSKTDPLTSMGSPAPASSGTADAKGTKDAKDAKDAKGGKDKKGAKPKEELGKTKVAIKLVPEGMAWGMGRSDLEILVDRFVDADFKPKYKAVGQSAPKLKALDVEAAEQKAAFRRSNIDLINGPTGLDSGPLVGEYSKGNGEAIMSLQRGPGVKIWFFFIGGRLWKTIEEVNLTKGGLYGENLEEAVKKILESVNGAPPNKIDANPEKGLYYDVFEWDDGKTHMRMWDRSGVFVIAREDRITLGNIANLRKNNVSNKDNIDPSVAKIMREGGAPPPPPPPDPKKDEKKKLTPRAGRSGAGLPPGGSGNPS